MKDRQGSDVLAKHRVQRSTRITSIDTHAHVFEHDLPLAQQRRYAPDYDAPLDAFLAQLDAHGFSHGVLVQPSFLGVDCDYLLDALAHASGRLRGIAVIERDCSASKLASMAQMGIVGVRLNLIGHEDRPLDHWLSTQTLTHIRELGWHVEVHAEAARLDGIVLPLLAEGVNVVVDHFGRPDPFQGIHDAGFRRLLEFAETRRVWVKISAAYRTWDDPLASIDHVHEAFHLLKRAYGVERLMWGSDWPHTRFESSGHFARALDLLSVLLPDEKERETVLSHTPSARYMFESA